MGGRKSRIGPRGNAAGPTVLKILELTALAILAHISFSGVRVCLSLAAIDAGAEPLVIGSLLSVYALVPTILSLVGGRWIDRIGVRWPLFVGTGLMVLGGLLSYLVPHLWTLFVTSTLVGSGFLLSQLVMQKMTGDLGRSTEHRRKVFGILAIGYSISGVVGPSSSGVLYDRVGGAGHIPRAVARLSLLVMFWLLLRRRRLPGPGRRDAGAAPLLGPAEDAGAAPALPGRGPDLVGLGRAPVRRPDLRPQHRPVGDRGRLRARRLRPRDAGGAADPAPAQLA